MLSDDISSLDSVREISNLYKDASKDLMTKIDTNFRGKFSY